MSRVGDLIRKTRGKALRQDHLAEKIGMAPQFLYSIEKGQKPMPLKYLKPVSAALGIPRDEIIKAELTDYEDVLNEVFPPKKGA